MSDDPLIDDWRDTLANEIDHDGGLDEWARRRTAARARSDSPDTASAGTPETARAPMAADVLWKAGDVASFLGVSASWVRHASAAGHLPCTRFGHNVRFEPEAIRAFARGEGSGRGRTVVPSVKPRLERKRGGSR